MRILVVNRINNRSVGTIAKKIGSLAKERLKAEVFYFWGETDGSPMFDNECAVNNKKRLITSKIRLIDLFYKKKSGSQQLIKYIKKIKPSFIHLHCIHGGFFDFKTLFKYLVKTQIPLVITAHDCWYVTGGCSHFIVSKCNKWNNGDNCSGCKLNRFFHFFYKEKFKYLKKANIKEIITCSNFVKTVFETSFLANVKVTTIHNGVDLETFTNKKLPSDINVFIKYNVPFASNYLLFVSAFWHESKGSKILSELSFRFEGIYNILIIGKQFDKPAGNSSFIIESIDNKKDLAVFYRNALLNINPTLEDNYPTTTLEATSCGTRTIVFDVGGCKEAIYGVNGLSVEHNNINEITNTILLLAKASFDSEAVRKIAELYFDDNICFDRYIEIYKEIGG